MSDIELGDIVEVVKHSRLVGMYGKVVAVSSEEIEVELDVFGRRARTEFQRNEINVIRKSES